MSSLDLKAYEIFKSKFGENEAAIVIEYFESKTDQQFEAKTDGLATKLDISDLRAEFRVEIAQSKVDLVKWMVGLWIAQMAAIVGLYLTR